MLDVDVTTRLTDANANSRIRWNREKLSVGAGV